VGGKSCGCDLPCLPPLVSSITGWIVFLLVISFLACMLWATAESHKTLSYVSLV